MDHQAFAQLLGNYGEFIGAIAVVVTLFYLAVQVRQSKQATEANTRSMDESRKVSLAHAYQERAATRLRLPLGMAESDYMAPIEARLRESGWPENLDALNELEYVERLRYENWLWAAIVRLDTGFYYRQLGLLDDDGWHLVQNRMRQMATTFQLIAMDRGVPPAFAAEMNRLAEEMKSSQA